MSHISQAEAILEELEKRLAETVAEREADDAEWEELACGQDTEEAETSGEIIGREHGLQAAIDVVQNIIHYGIFAFDPSHPRFKTGSPSH